MKRDVHLEADLRDRSPAYKRVVDVCDVQRWHSKHIDSREVVLDERIERGEYSSQIKLRDLHGSESALQVARDVDMDRRQSEVRILDTNINVSA